MWIHVRQSGFTNLKLSPSMWRHPVAVGGNLGGYNLMQLICKIVTLPPWSSCLKLRARRRAQHVQNDAYGILVGALSPIFPFSGHRFPPNFPPPSNTFAERIKSKGKVR